MHQECCTLKWFERQIKKRKENRAFVLKDYQEHLVVLLCYRVQRNWRVPRAGSLAHTIREDKWFRVETDKSSDCSKETHHTSDNIN